jgi:hypothetical protein
VIVGGMRFSSTPRTTPYKAWVVRFFLLFFVHSVGWLVVYTPFSYSFILMYLYDDRRCQYRSLLRRLAKGLDQPVSISMKK